jgi:hypothetical protein
MSEQIQRGRQRRRDRDEDTATSTAITTPDAEVAEGVECCLSDIDEALADAECCLSDATEAVFEARAEALALSVEALRESVKPRPYSAWSDQERIDAGDPERWTDQQTMKVLGTQEYGEFLRARDLYDTSYQELMGISNHRDCGCGCR